MRYLFLGCRFKTFRLRQLQQLNLALLFRDSSSYFGQI